MCEGNDKNKRKHFHVWATNDRGNMMYMLKKVYHHRTAAYRKLAFYGAGAVLECKSPPLHECSYQEHCTCEETKS